MQEYRVWGFEGRQGCPCSTKWLFPQPCAFIPLQNRRYQGEYADDLPHGHGVYLFASGQMYEGEWSQGKKHGWSIYSVDDGESSAPSTSSGRPLSLSLEP